MSVLTVVVPSSNRGKDSLVHQIPRCIRTSCICRTDNGSLLPRRRYIVGIPTLPLLTKQRPTLEMVAEITVSSKNKLDEEHRVTI